MGTKNLETDLNNLTNEELYVISLEKTNKKVATKKALVAQKILWERAKCPFHSSSHYDRDNTPVKRM